MQVKPMFICPGYPYEAPPAVGRIGRSVGVEVGIHRVASDLPPAAAKAARPPTMGYETSRTFTCDRLVTCRPNVSPPAVAVMVMRTAMSCPPPAASFKGPFQPSVIVPLSTRDSDSA